MSLNESVSLCIYLLTVACSREMQQLFLFLLAIRCGGKKISVRVNSAAQVGVGSGQMISFVLQLTLTLELTLASCFMRQFMRLIVQCYSQLTSNHRRVFVITSFFDQMWSFTVVKTCYLKPFISLHKLAFQMYTFFSRKSHPTISYRNCAFIILYNL